jgi:hypothetical protein
MTKKTKKKATDQSSSAAAGEGAATGAGRSISPAELPEEPSQPDPANPRTPPLGLPVSAEEYRRLKQQAEKGKPASDEIAQEDPSARQPDG